MTHLQRTLVIGAFDANAGDRRNDHPILVGSHLGSAEL